MRSNRPAIASSGPAMRYARVVAVAVVAGLLITVNLVLTSRSLGAIAAGAPAVDWIQYVEASRRLDGDELYAVTDTYAYHYSPILAGVFGFLAPVGAIGWRIFHLLGALAMPSWPLRIATLTSWPFWYDTEAGNVLVFVVLAAAWAIRGNPIGTGAYFLLLVTVPRPLMIPVAVWLLWRRPQWRVPFAALFSIHAIAVLATGWGDGWVAAMLAAADDVSNPSNIGPSRLVGTAPWLLVGLPLAAWLTWKGRLGLASLAASPYWLPYYLLVLLLELPQRFWSSAKVRLSGPAAS